MSYPTHQTDINNQIEWAREIAKRVSNRRAELGLTQADLAYRANKSLGTVAKMEQGAAGFPAISTLVAIAEALDLSLDYLVLAAEPTAPKCVDMTVDWNHGGL